MSGLNMQQSTSVQQQQSPAPSPSAASSSSSAAAAPPPPSSSSSATTSSVWGMISEEKDNSGGWGVSSSTAATPSPSTGNSVWPSSSTASSMQGNTSVASSSASPSLLGWSGSSTSSSIGAQTSTTDSAPSGDLGSSMWQGLSSTLAADWGGSISSSSSSSSVIANSISSIPATVSVSSSSAPGPKPGDPSSDQWSRGAVGAAGGWGGSHPDPPKPDSESGWGSPDPLVNPGTEGWNQSDTKGLPSAQPGWGTRPNAPPTSWGGQEKPAAAPGAPAGGWAQEKPVGEPQQPPPPQQQPPQQPPQQQRGSWGSEPEPKSSASSWGASAAPAESRSSSTSSWGDQEKPQSQQWGAANPSNPPSQWGASNTSTSPTQQPNMSGGTHPRPIGSQSGPPSTWAQAAGRGLPPKPEVPPVETVRDLKQEYISEAISSCESWGTTPVRQDTTWDMTESPKTPRKNMAMGMGGAGMGGGGSSSSSSTSSGGDDNLWHQPNDGTAIWESAKSSAPTQWEQKRPQTNPAQASGGVNNTQWNQREDSSQWSGPSPNDNNMWNGPPKDQSGQWNMRRNSESNRGSWSDSDGPNGPSGPSGPSGPNGPHGPNGPNGPNGPWNGRDQKPQWNGPNPNDKPSWAGPDSQWGGAGGGGGAGNPPPDQGPKLEWNSETNQWQRSTSGDRAEFEQQHKSNEWNPPKKDDNMWDRNGTNMWGDTSKTETGTWNQARGPSSRTSSGSWEERNMEQGGGGAGGWGNKPGAGGDVDNGTAYWGDPQGPGPGQRMPAKNWGGQGGPMGPGGPSGPNPMNQGPQGPMGGPRHEGAIGSWHQQNNPKQGWCDATPAKIEEWGGQGPPKVPGWNGPPDNQMIGQWQGPKPKGPGWSDAPDWGNAPKVPFGSGMMMKHPTMRSQLLQQLMDMGFKKEDAQNALISNNMNLEMAVADLVASAGGRKPDMDMDMKGRDDLGRDMGPPRMPAFSNSQNSQVMGGPQMMSGHLGKGPVHSPLSQMGGAAVQQRLLQQQMAAAAAKPPASTQAQPPSAYSMQQQLIQQQIVQQLHMAVQAGLISPQLLNQQLTPNMLVMLQQLLQLQQVLQRLVQQQQVIQQNRSVSPNTNRQRLEQVAVTIAKIRQQIVQQQQQISQAQKNMSSTGKPQAPSGSNNPASAAAAMVAPQQQQQQQQQQQPSSGAQSHQPVVSSSSSQELLKELPSDMSNLQMKDSAPRTSSRLVQWKLPSPDREGSDGGSSVEELNRAPGSKPAPSPSLTAKSEAGLPFSDSTWSTNEGSSTSSWPGATSEHDNKSITSNDSRDDVDTDDSTDPKASLDIVEFVPGKQWRGTSKNAEDDPFLTPGDLNRSLSVNTIKEDYITSTLGNKTGTSPTPLDGSSQWSSVGNLAPKQKWASPSGDASDFWGQSAKTRPPPGLSGGGGGNKNAWPRQPGGAAAPGNQNFHRSTSWAPGDRANMMSQDVSGGWGGPSGSPAASNWLVLKNLKPQVDANTLKTLCMQHGPLQGFYMFQHTGIVGYSSKEEATKAQKALNSCSLGSTTIMAEFCSEADVARLMAQGQQAPPPQSTSSLWPSSSSRGLKSESSSPGGSQWPNGTSSMWSSAGSGGSGSSLWAPALDESPQNALLPGDLLGGQ